MRPKPAETNGVLQVKDFIALVLLTAIAASDVLAFPKELARETGRMKAAVLLTSKEVVWRSLSFSPSAWIRAY